MPSDNCCGVILARSATAALPAGINLITVKREGLIFYLIFLMQVLRPPGGAEIVHWSCRILSANERWEQ